MGFFGFNQEEILPYSKSNQAKRDARVASNLASLKEEMEMEREFEASSKKIESEILLEDAAKKLVNSRTIERRRRFAEDAKLQEEVNRKMLVGFLTETTLKGLVFDKEFLAVQELALRENMTNFFNEAFNNGALNEDMFINSDSILIQEAYNELMEISKKLVANRDNIDIFSEDTILQALSEAPKSDDLSEEIADTVKEKVTDTIESEKKISKKKEEEKAANKDEEAEEAADSLDSDVDAADTTTGAEPDSEEEMEEDSEEEDDEVSDTEEDEEMEDDELSDTEEDSEEEDDELSDSDLEDNESEEEAPTEDIDTENPAEEDLSADAEATSGSGSTMKITVETNGTNVTVTANKSESTDFLNIFGSSKLKEMKNKSLFRNIMEGTLKESVALLNENGSFGTTREKTINMDFVLAESIVKYTILETLYTSKVINPSPMQLKNYLTSLNLK